jgi:hypothetical protein
MQWIPKLRLRWRLKVADDELSVEAEVDIEPP